MNDRKPPCGNERFASMSTRPLESPGKATDFGLQAKTWLMRIDDKESDKINKCHLLFAEDCLLRLEWSTFKRNNEILFLVRTKCTVYFHRTELELLENLNDQVAQVIYGSKWCFQQTLFHSLLQCQTPPTLDYANSERKLLFFGRWHQSFFQKQCLQSQKLLGQNSSSVGKTIALVKTLVEQ